MNPFSIIIAGDYCMHHRMQRFSSKQIVSSLDSIPHILHSCNYSIVNLECCISDKSLMPIKKCGKNLQNSSESIQALKSLGFCGVTLANNHFADFGTEGVRESLSIISRFGLDFFGAGIDLQSASEVKYISVNNNRIAIISCCEHEFTIAKKNKGGSNPLDLILLYKSITEAKKNSDYIIVIVHGGSEYYNLPTPRMQQVYRHLIDLGADSIVNHHQHCYSGFEYYKSRPIVYGLGNFCFDWEGRKSSSWNEGYMVKLTFEDSGISISTIPYMQCDDKLGIQLIQDRNEFDEKLSELNNIIADEQKLEKKYHDFVQQRIDEYLSLFELPQNKLLRRLSKKNMLPKPLREELLPIFLTEDRVINLLSYFQCEAHRDLMISILNEYIKK